MQKIDKQRSQNMSREQQLKIKKDMEIPINKFINTRNEDKTMKYPVAEKMRNYLIINPDPVLTDMRLANGYLHEIRWRLERANNHFNEYTKDKHSTFIETDNDGNKIVKNHYGGYIAETQVVQLVLSRLRFHLSDRLISKCDKDLFTFEKFNEFVTKVEAKVTELGFELFPTEIKLIEPL